MNSSWLTAAPGSTNLWNNLRNVNLTLCCSFSLVLMNSMTVTGSFKCWQQVRTCQPSGNWIWWFRQKMLTGVGSAAYQRSYRCWLSLSCGLADVPDVLLEEPHFHMSYNYADFFCFFFFWRSLLVKPGTTGYVCVQWIRRVSDLTGKSFSVWSAL